MGCDGAQDCLFPSAHAEGCGASVGRAPLIFDVRPLMNLRPYLPEDWDRLCLIHDAARMHELRASGLVEAFLTLEQTAEG